LYANELIETRPLHLFVKLVEYFPLLKQFKMT